MAAKSTSAEVSGRTAPLEMDAEEFRELGYRVVDRIAEFLKSLPA